MKAIKISTDGTIMKIDIAMGGGSMRDLSTLQEQVGGCVEFLGVDQHLAAIINEEGKLDGLPPNSVATAFAHKHCGIAPSDIIVGDMLLVGSTADGDTVDVPDTAMELVQQ